MMNFVLITQYITHNKKILKYMKQAIYWINYFKWAFTNYQSINKKDEKSHFNIFKLHSITYYVNQIRLFENAVEMNSAYFEIMHKYFVKAFFNWINKWKDEFEQQILFHNIQLINLLAMRDVLNYHASKNVTQTEKNNKVKVTKFFKSLNFFK